MSAGLVQRAEDRPWSSCRAHFGLAPAQPWLAVDELQGFMLGRTLRGQRDRNTAAKRYAALVNDGLETDADFWATHLRGQIYLGDEHFAECVRARAEPSRLRSGEVPARQRSPAASGPKTWAGWLQQHAGQRPQALHAAYRARWKSMPGLASGCGLSVAHVSRLITAMEGERGET